MQNTDLENTGSSLRSRVTLKTIDDYCRDLDNPLSEVRSHAARQLRYFGDEAASCLCRALEDEHLEVRLTAVESLSWLRNKSCAERIAGLLHDQNYHVAGAAASCLEELLGHQAVDYIWPLIRDPDPDRRKEMLKVAGAFPGGGREEDLFQLLQQSNSPEEASLYALALAEMQYYPAMDEIVRWYVNSEGEVKEDLKSCMASLTGDEEIMAHYDLSEVIELFSTLDEKLPWEIKKELRPMEKALRKHNFRRFTELALEFSFNSAVLPLLETDQLNPESLSKKDPEESLKDLLNLLNDRQRASFYIISYFANTPDVLTTGLREDIEEYLGIITCCMVNMFLESNRLLDMPSLPPGPGSMPDAALLVNKLSTAAEIIPRWLIREIANCGENAVPNLVGLLQQNDAHIPRQSAIKALSLIGGPEAVTGLLSVYDGLLVSQNFDLCTEIDDVLANNGQLALDPVIQYIRRKDAEGGSFPGIMACSALSMIRHPRSFDFLCSRLSDDKEDVLQGAIDDLLAYGDPAAIPALLAMAMTEDGSGYSTVSAKLAVIGLCESNGVVIPELSQLREKALFDQEMWPEGDYIPFEDDEDEDDFFTNRHFKEDFKNDPFVREGRKVGRNEPCPCGRGKKYKKCCGRVLGT